MAIKEFKVSVDLRQNELQNAVIQNLTFAPLIAKPGQLFYGTAGVVDKGLFVWTGEVWVDLTRGGGFPTSSFKAVLSSGKTLGKYTNGQTVPSYGSAEEMINDLGRERTNPTFYPGRTNMSAITNPASTSSLEVGTLLALDFTITADQMDSGAPSNFRVFKDGVYLPGSSDTGTDSIVLSETSVGYKGAIDYAEGEGTKPDSLGDPVENTLGPLTDVFSSTLSYRGYRKIFYGSVANPASTASDVRDLTHLLNKTSGTSTFIINTGTTNKVFQFWLDDSLTLSKVVDLDASNLTITGSYIETSLAVYDASLSTTISGKLYTMSILGPYSPSHKHEVTFTN